MSVGDFGRNEVLRTDDDPAERWDADLMDRVAVRDVYGIQAAAAQGRVHAGHGRASPRCRGPRSQMLRPEASTLRGGQTWARWIGRVAKRVRAGRAGQSADRWCTWPSRCDDSNVLVSNAHSVAAGTWKRSMPTPITWWPSLA